MDSNDDLLGYKPNLIKKLSSARPIVQSLNKQWGEGKWGMHEVALWKQDKDQRDEANRAKALALKVANSKLPAGNFSQEVQARVQQYLVNYERPTPNDIASLAHMAQIEIQIEDVQAKLKGDITADEYKKYSDILGSLTTKHLALQSALGIGRTQREESETGLDHVREMVEGAKKMLDARAVKIECGKCQEKGQKFNLGFVYTPFVGFVPVEIKTVCPKCRGDIIIQMAVTKKPETLPPFVKAEESKT